MTAPSLGSARRISWTAGGAFAAFYVFYTTAPLTFADASLGAGMSVGIAMLVVAAVQPFVFLLGRWIESRWRQVASAIVAMGAGSAIMPFADHWPGIALLGAGFGVFVVASTAWVKETASPGGLGKALGTYGFGSAIGGALGAPIGLYIGAELGSHGTALVGSLIALAALLPILRLGSPQQVSIPRFEGGTGRAVDSARTSRSSTRPALLTLGAHLVAVTIYAAALSALSATLDGQSIWLPVVAAFTIQISLAAGRMIGGRAVAAFSPLKVGIPALILLMLGATGFMFSTHPVAMLAASMIVGLASGASQTVALTALMNRARTAAATTRASACWNICFDIGLGLGALAAGASLAS